VGSVILPPTGSIYLDSSALIYSVETHPAYWPLLEPVWQAARAGQIPAFRKVPGLPVTVLSDLLAP
jgi:hypothetical protein